MPQTDEAAEYVDWHLTLFHRRYILGNDSEHNSAQFDCWAAAEKHLRKAHRAALVLPVYLYDHSGLCFKIGSFQGLLPQGHAQFDSMRVGFIWATKREMNRYFHARKYTPEIEQKTIRYMTEALEDYTERINGWDNNPDDEE
jgi:hypothetical protein